MSDEQSQNEERDDLTPDESETTVADESGTTSSRKRGSNLVYAALGAGALVLALLLLIVWLSSRGDESSDLPLCLDITAAAAANAVLAGQVETVDVLIDQGRPLQGLTAVQLKMTDGECRRLPEGADNRDELFYLLGVVALFNEAGDVPVDVRYLRQAVPQQLLSTSTPVPSETPIPSPTATATITPPVTATLPPTPTETVTPQPSPASTNAASPIPASTDAASPIPAASPAASPDASPQASPSPTSTP